MVSNRRVISLGFSAQAVLEGGHLCFLYDSEAERLDVIGRFLASGLEQREKVICLVNRTGSDTLLEHLESHGVAPTEAGLVVADAAVTYRRGGHFNATEMLVFVGEFYEAARMAGYAGARGTGEARGSPDEQEGGDLAELMSYEARLNDVLEVSPMTVCCQYDVRCFDGRSLLDVLSVHPIAIVHGQLVQNPFYVHPEVFLGELERRRSAHD